MNNRKPNCGYYTRADPGFNGRSSGSVDGCVGSCQAFNQVISGTSGQVQNNTSFSHTIIGTKPKSKV